jgi:LacI family transcriptional regulator
VLLVFLATIEDSSTMLRGIAHHQRTHRQWNAYLDDEGRAENDSAWILTQEWDGVISRHASPAFADSCAQRGIPLIDLNDTPALAGVPKIRPDNRAIGHLGAEHFLERGFLNFAFTGYSTESWSGERRDGFLEALHLAGRTAEVFDVAWPSRLTPDIDEAQVTDLVLWLSRLPKPVAVMAGHDLRALQVLNAARAAGLLIPEEVALLGVNNDTVRCELANPSLSSVALNSFGEGFLAAEMLDTLMSGGKLTSSEVRVEPGEIIVRPSSDSLAIGDRAIAAALSYIREQACSGVAVQEVAQHVSASRSQLEKKFRRLLGRSPQAEIRRVQIAKIKQLLTETDLPLKAISELTGFDHMEYMSVVFKRLTGETPGAYRRAIRTGVKAAS